MDAPATVERPAALVVAAAAAGLVVLLLVDIMLSDRLFGVRLPAMLADLAVLATVLYSVSAVPRTIVPASIAASALSVALSAVTQIGDVAAWSSLSDYRGWPGFVELSGLALLAGWSVRSAPRRVAQLAAAAFAVALIAVVAWRNDGHYMDALRLLCASAWVGVMAAGLYLRVLDARQLEDAQRVRHQERLEIARELHDVVAHHVTGIVVQAQAARLVAASQPQVAQRALDRIERAGAEALEAMRSMVGALREADAAGELQPMASIADLRAMGDLPARGELPVHLDIDEEAARLPGAVIASVHRIAREAVTNARRHAVGATNIDVNVACGDGVVQLRVTNDGGPAIRAPGGFGLHGMAERAAALGGDFDAGPLPDGGWRVAADLPVTIAAVGDRP